MQAISKQTYRFTGGVVITPSPLPQNVPDELKNDPYFQLAVKDGSITLVELAHAAEPDAQPATRRRKKSSEAADTQPSETEPAE